MTESVYVFFDCCLQVFFEDVQSVHGDIRTAATDATQVREAYSVNSPCILNPGDR